MPLVGVHVGMPLEAPQEPALLSLRRQRAHAVRPYVSISGRYSSGLSNPAIHAAAWRQVRIDGGTRMM